MPCRRLILVLGDQLDPRSAAFEDADPERDVVVMAEVEAELHRHWNHKQRVAVFLAAMRHHRDDLRERGYTVRYQAFTDDDPAASLPDALARAIDDLEPEEVVSLEPGRHDLIAELEVVCAERDTPLDLREDTHFLCSRARFADWAEGRKLLRMEDFYRAQRKRFGVLMTDDGEPEGDRWNFDKENRESFGKDGPPETKEPIHFRPDDVTQGVLDDIDQRLGDLPGKLDAFDWPVTRDEARRALNDFVEHRLPHFGTHQDAMWTGRRYLYHSRISPAINLKLLDPRHVIDKAEAAYHDGHAPLNAVEGFIRQVLGWREFIRGVYWLTMPDYLERNALEADRPLPEFYWTADTDMACVKDVVEGLIETGYAHHIQRLMVTGLFAQLYGVTPQAVHDWYMAFFVDSVEWVTLPNTLGMSQWGDGGVVGSKPYVATGKYVNRMSNYCQGCRYDPAQATGDDACPFTTLYWDFLARHRETLEANTRMQLQLKNLDRKDPDELKSIRGRASWLKGHPEAL